MFVTPVSPWLVRGCVGGSVVLPPGVCHPCVSRSWSTAVLASSSGGVTTTRHIVFFYCYLVCRVIGYSFIYCIALVLLFTPVCMFMKNGES